jgi:hypothetical protein
MFLKLKSSGGKRSILPWITYAREGERPLQLGASLEFMSKGGLKILQIVGKPVRV